MGLDLEFMFVHAEEEKEYFSQLIEFVEDEYKKKTIFPEKQNILNALKLTKLDNIKVVILGQDPYHGKGQAHGLSFSVPKGIKIPPSLRNIYKEIANEYEVEPPESGDLTDWAKQGVLLLNSVLTVEKAKAASHQKKGWETFTDNLIQFINDHCENVVFLLWGSYAHKKGKVIDKRKHLVLESVHPSPLSAHRGFFGCGHFKKANEYLTKNNLESIHWI